jgi:hypothetical protein
MARRERLKRFPSLWVRFQAGVEIGREGKVPRLAVEAQFHADQIANVGACCLAQRRIDLHAEASATGRDESGTRELAVHDGRDWDVLRRRRLALCACGTRGSHLPLKFACNLIRHINVPHHPDAVDGRLEAMGLRRWSYARPAHGAETGYRNWMGGTKQKGRPE